VERSGVEGSRQVTGIVSQRDSSTSLGMTVGSFALLIRSDCALNRIGDTVGLAIDLIQLASLY